MTIIFTILHAGVCILLAVIILMQSGRGGGLTEGFSSAESMLGAKTNDFMVKATTVFASLFLITCLSLAFISSKKEESLMSNKVSLPADVPTSQEAPVQEVSETLEEKSVQTEPTPEPLGIPVGEK